jgi:membrane protease YdiL (CAAX protease family)
MTQTEPENIADVEGNNVETSKTIAYPDLRSTITLFFIFVLYAFAVLMLTGILIGNPNTLFHNSLLMRSLLNLLIYAATLLLTINYAIKGSKKKEGNFPRIKVNVIQGWLVAVIIVAALALIIPLQQAGSLVPMSKSMQAIFERTFTKNVFSIITMVIVAPIMEEILCRGIILRGLLKNYSPYKAILISAIFFGAIHLNPWQGIPAFFSGLFLGWVYYKTQSIIPTMIIHATINITGALFLFLPDRQQDLLSFLGPTYYLIAFAASIVVFIVACVIIHRKALPIAESIK